jgi:5-methylcytosine-specific restriction endonuclease McrA
MKHIHLIPISVARRINLKRFFTGEPCLYGHIDERNTKSGSCVSCDKERKRNERQSKPERLNEISRKSRAKHAERRREDNKKWREENSEALRISKKRYVIENADKVKKAKQKYYQENKERVLAMGRAHRKANIERYRQVSRDWRENNKDVVRALNRNRKRKIKNAGGSHNASDILRIIGAQKSRCAGCYEMLEGKNYHVDHIQPIALGGDNSPSNLQILCPPCNLKKGAKPPEQFYQERGFLI